MGAKNFFNANRTIIEKMKDLNWSLEETRHLIKAWADCQPDLNAGLIDRKKMLLQILEKFVDRFDRDHEQIKNKIQWLTSRYKKLQGGTDKEKAEWPFYYDIDEVLGEKKHEEIDIKPENVDSLDYLTDATADSGHSTGEDEPEDTRSKSPLRWMASPKHDDTSSMDVEPNQSFDNELQDAQSFDNEPTGMDTDESQQPLPSPFHGGTFDFALFRRTLDEAQNRRDHEEALEQLREEVMRELTNIQRDFQHQIGRFREEQQEKLRQQEQLHQQEQQNLREYLLELINNTPRTPPPSPNGSVVFSMKPKKSSVTFDTSSDESSSSSSSQERRSRRYAIPPKSPRRVSKASKSPRSSEIAIELSHPSKSPGRVTKAPKSPRSKEITSNTNRILRSQRNGTVSAPASPFPNDRVHRSGHLYLRSL